jgi:serine/threonine-protein kinase
MSANGGGGAGKASGPDSLSATQAEALDRACDRFEAEWRAGGRPKIEDHLGGATEPLRSALLGDLIAVELDWRRRHGERPEPAEYHDRFPGHAQVVSAGLGTAVGPPQPGSVPARAVDPANGLLLGLLAFQNHCIDREALLTALTTWAADKTTPLGRALVARGALDAETHALLEALAEKHLEAHGGDAEKSLAALAIGASTREVLARVGDPEIQATLSHAGSGLSPTEPDAEGKVSHGVGSATGEGQRFRVVRPHARGGLGAVYVALDTELHREVALKQILESHADDPASRSRFLLEAEITGGLEHPGIVPVYGLGTYSGGRPYYAMRFIRGDTLKEAIGAFHADDSLKRDPGRRSLELRKLLRRFLDVCNAIEYAHSRGVLHRDIKPGNVIVGTHGETLVVDWGLAKALGRRGDGPTSEEWTHVAISASSSAAETLPGSAIGSPAFMSPEQARGDLEALGPRSDVYSLGATLYSVLTGKQPFEGDDVGTVLRRVEAGEFPPPRSLDPTIDRALEAVCLKAMALRTQDRYASSRALAEDVEGWTADEPVSAWREPLSRRAIRWLMRHRTSVSTAAAAVLVALMGLTVVAAVQRQSNRNPNLANQALTIQRERTEQRETQAIDAVKRFRDAITAEPELKNSPSLQQLRKRLLKEPLAFFRTLREGLQADRDTRRESLARLASASAELGSLANEIGDKQDALAAHREAMAIQERLARANPTVTEYQRNLATSRNDIGILLNATGATDRALESYREALAVRERLARENATVPPFQNDLAGSHNNIGNLLSDTGATDQALESYGKAVAIWERLARANPTVTEYQRNLGQSYHNIGVLLNDNGETDRALESYRKALAVRERLARENLSVNRYQHDLAWNYNNTGVLLNDTGATDRALESYGKALAIWERLAREDPTVSEYQSKLGWVHNNIGILLSDTGATDRALESFGKAAAIRERLARANPTVTQYQRNLAGSHENIGTLLSATGANEQAIKAYASALAIHEKWFAEDWSRFRAMGLIGEALVRMKKYADAEPRIMRGYEGVKARAAKIPSDERAEILHAAERVVRLYEAWGKPEKAAEWKKNLGMEDLPSDVFARP